MILYLSLLVLASTVLNIPAWMYARRRQGANALLLWLGVPALLTWFGLMLWGVGQSSLSNLIEGVWLMGASVVLAYVQVFLVDRFVKKPAPTTGVIVTILCLGAVILRVTMPALPE